VGTVATVVLVTTTAVSKVVLVPAIVIAVAIATRT